MFRTKGTVRQRANPTAHKRPAKGDAKGDDFAKRADRAFKKAAKAAVAENDARGIPTHGSKRGKLVVRTPIRRQKAAIVG